LSIELLDRKPPPADFRIAYGPGEFHFGDLRLPERTITGDAPLVVFLHGGWWKAEYGLEYGGHLCADLKAHGVATWSLEYRRVGNAGGGWPGTFEDVAAGFDYVATLAKTHPLDLGRIVVAGHSAGGHLAFWLAGRPHIPEDSVLRNPQPHLEIQGAVSLAGAVDLGLTIELARGEFVHDRDEVVNLMGGTPEQVPERYAAGDPGELWPLNVPQYLVQGTEDDQVPPELPRRWTQQGRSRGEQVELQIVPGADHFDVVDPKSKAWPLVREMILHALAGRRFNRRFTSAAKAALP
jgi:acetyl esterase/lipase